MGVFLAMAVCVRTVQELKGGIVNVNHFLEVVPRVLEASSKEEAEGKVLAEIRKTFPPADGYGSFTVAASEFSQEECLAWATITRSQKDIPA